MAGPARTSRTSLALRAAIALSMLVGFYAALVVVLGAVIVGELLIVRDGHSNIFVIAITIIGGFVCLRAITDLFRTGSYQAAPATLAATRASQPRLWQFIDDLAHEIGTTPPAEIYLEAGVNAAVLESGGSGIRKGRRVMLIGCGLLQLLDAQQLRAVLTHEYGHYVGGDTWLGSITYRGFAAVGRTAHGLTGHPVLQRLVLAYGNVYRRVTLAVRRHQELTADALAVRVSGCQAMVTALQEIQAGDAAFRFFINCYVAPVWRAGQAPTNLYAGFRAMVAEPSRQAEMAEVRAELEGSPGDPFDSHPTLGARIVAAKTVPDTAIASASHPARELLFDADTVETDMTDRISRQATGREPTERVDWDDAADTVFAPTLRRQAAAVLTLIPAAKVQHRPDTPCLSDLIDLAASSNWRMFADDIAAPTADASADDNDDQRRRLITVVLAEVIGPALVDAGAAEWELSWSGPIRLVNRRGRDIYLSNWVRPIIGNPAAAKKLYRKLRAAKVRLDWSPSDALTSSVSSRADGRWPG
ncbi:MAG: hypothetical protein QOG53_2711 [Frankiales bacterium]|jgi:Zn-dependent protease with chaperone function|nr:hypothetical protein [Frankiales bacterium]